MVREEVLRIACGRGEPPGWDFAGSSSRLPPEPAAPKPDARLPNDTVSAHQDEREDLLPVSSSEESPRSRPGRLPVHCPSGRSERYGQAEAAGGGWRQKNPGQCILTRTEALRCKRSSRSVAGRKRAIVPHRRPINLPLLRDHEQVGSCDYDYDTITITTRREGKAEMRA